MRKVGDHESDLEARLQQRRRELVDYFCAIPSDAEPLALQEALAAEIRRSEAEDNDLDLWRRHRRLTRIIGDGIAFTLIHDHTIRTLGRHPSSGAAGLLTQADDFDFVLAVTKTLSTAGYIPVISDVTNLVRIGDIVAVHHEHVLVLECKNTTLPSRFPKTGRLGRQERRGNDAAEYLRKSQIPEPGGHRGAISIDLPGPEWQVLEELGREIVP